MHLLTFSVNSPNNGGRKTFKNHNAVQQTNFEDILTRTAYYVLSWERFHCIRDAAKLSICCVVPVYTQTSWTTFNAYFLVPVRGDKSVKIFNGISKIFIFLISLSLSFLRHMVHTYSYNCIWRYKFRYYYIILSYCTRLLFLSHFVSVYDSATLLRFG